MKKSIISIIFCVILLSIVFENFSAGIPLNISYNKNKTNLSQNICVEVNPVEKNTCFSNTYSDTIVNITSPENGTHLDVALLTVSGYAYSNDGLNLIEWTWYWNNNPYYYNISALAVYTHYNFTLRIHNLPIGTHKVVVNFSDINNHKGSDSVIVYYTGNQPPEKPNKPIGPNIGSIGVSYSYSTNSTDPNNDKIKYGWDWNGDGTIDQWTNISNSGMTINTAHAFTNPGNYSIKVIAEDEHGAQSVFSESLPVMITSNPPHKPIIPSGSNSGKAGESYTYQTSTIDPDGDQLYYMWDWDDETTPLTWDGPYTSGQTADASHIWSVKGTYSIKVKAKDANGLESTWSDPFPISIPYSYKSIQIFLELLIQLSTNAFPILQQLLDQ